MGRAAAPGQSYSWHKATARNAPRENTRCFSFRPSRYVEVPRIFPAHVRCPPARAGDHHRAPHVRHAPWHGGRAALPGDGQDQLRQGLQGRQAGEGPQRGHQGVQLPAARELPAAPRRRLHRGPSPDMVFIFGAPCRASAGGTAARAAPAACSHSPSRFAIFFFPPLCCHVAGASRPPLTPDAAAAPPLRLRARR